MRADERVVRQKYKIMLLGWLDHRSDYELEFGKGQQKQDHASAMTSKIETNG
jgi:hypothetical protein